LEEKQRTKMKKKLLISLYLPIITSILLCSCSADSSNTESNSQSTTSSKEKEIHGVYVYADSSVESIITVSTNSWSGELVLKSGFGSSYDNSNISYSSGIVRDAILYDDSGYIKLGSVNGTSLSIPIGSSRVKHYK
jgi:hypothetical protein